MLKLLEKISAGLGRIEQAILASSLALMILFAFLQVVLRFLPGEASVTWLEPFARQLVLWVGLIGASLATAENRHISIEAFPKLLSPAGKRWLTLIVQVTAAGIAVLLGILSWIWLIEVDRQEIYDAQRCAAALRRHAESAQALTRAEAASSLREEAARRVDELRLRGFARLIRSSQTSLLRLDDLDPFDLPFVVAGRNLVAATPSLASLPLAERARLDTVELLAKAFEDLADKDPAGNNELARKIFQSQPASPDIASALGDPIAIAFYDASSRLDSGDQPPAQILEARAESILAIAEQKAFMELFGVRVHDWWFHIIVPIALFIMAFRFVINAVAALALSPEELERRQEVLERDIEAFEAHQIDSVETPEEPAPQEDPIPEVRPPSPPPPPIDLLESERFPLSDRPGTERHPAALAPVSMIEDDEDVPTGALETCDIDDSDAIVDDIDTAPPPTRTSSSEAPKLQTSGFDDDEDEIDQAVMDELGQTSEDFPDPDEESGSGEQLDSSSSGPDHRGDRN